MSANSLKQWRKRLGLSLNGAAQALGCSKTSIIAWERGQRIPHYIALACAAIAQGLPPVE